MGLFNRGFKPNLPEKEPPPSTNGDAPSEEDAMPPTYEEGRPEPAPPQPPDSLEPEPAEPEPVKPEPAEPEPVKPEPPNATSSPPVNQAEPDPGDEGRISAHEALAPTRAPGTTRPPGAHIGD